MQHPRAKKRIGGDVYAIRETEKKTLGVIEVIKDINYVSMKDPVDFVADLKRLRKEICASENDSLVQAHRRCCLRMMQWCASGNLIADELTKRGVATPEGRGLVMNAVGERVNAALVEAGYEPCWVPE